VVPHFPRAFSISMTMAPARLKIRRIANVICRMEMPRNVAKSIEYGSPMRGRKPKPTTLQISEGDPRKLGVHRLEQKLGAEAKGTRGLPKCPTHLKGLARKAWRFWSEELERMNLDCRPDAQMLEGACVAYEAAVECYETIQNQGRLVAKRILDPQTKTLVVANVKPHPAVAQMNAAWLLLKAFCSEFGLSPVSRTRLAIDNPADAEDDLLEILSQPRERKVLQPFDAEETIQ
jgi:P27 family predicted phage terminase small subunit